MAKNVIVQVLGGAKQVLDNLNSVGDIKSKLDLPNHTATVNGDTENDTYELQDGDFVSLAPAVKGGC